MEADKATGLAQSRRKFFGVAIGIGIARMSDPDETVTLITKNDYTSMIGPLPGGGPRSAGGGDGGGGWLMMIRGWERARRRPE